MTADHGLSDRKLKILHAIIKTYLETGEPVGSRTISKYTDMNLSSATIRNEMADLEELGFIMQPHTSAGRIPSDKGYRLYVDMLMAEKEQELMEKEDRMLEKADRMEHLLKQAAKVLASSTNYATMVSTPMGNGNKIKFIQLTMVDNEQIIAVIVLGGNVIKNKIIRVEEPLSNENLLKLNMLLNTTLQSFIVCTGVSSPIYTWIPVLSSCDNVWFTSSVSCCFSSKALMISCALCLSESSGYLKMFVAPLV